MLHFDSIHQNIWYGPQLLHHSSPSHTQLATLDDSTLNNILFPISAHKNATRASCSAIEIVLWLYVYGGR